MPNFQRLLLCSFAILTSIGTSSTYANDGDPVAVRRWPDGAMSIETHWGLHVVIDPSDQTEKLLPRKPDLVVRTSEKNSLQLSRKPNQDKPEQQSGLQDQKIANSVKVQSIPSADGEQHLLSVSVDGVTVLVVPHNVLAADTIKKFPTEQADLLVLSTSGASTLAKASVVKFAADVGSQRMLLNVSGDLSESLLTKFQAAIGTDKPVTTVKHNTVAISKPVNSKSADLKVKDQKASTVEIMTLTDKPWKMPEDLSKLFVAMEKSSRDSQKVFAKLSVKQMNFKPANGTHTPRWNTEHMMGRQLQFFSQIYNKIDPTIPVMDLNPKQMPPDYRFAHPDWDGKEEARQMQRVSEFTRRFAYLLDGLDVNKRAPGSRWPSLRALLVQMFRHYSEHTANTVKKFSLPGFPEK